MKVRQSFALPVESWEVMLVKVTCYKARCLGFVAPDYVAYCALLNSLHLVNVLLEVKVPADGSILQEWTAEC